MQVSIQRLRPDLLPGLIPALSPWTESSLGARSEARQRMTVSGFTHYADQSQPVVSFTHRHSPYLATGRCIVNVVPLPGRLSTSITPWGRRIIAKTISKPRPVPAWFFLV